LGLIASSGLGRLSFRFNLFDEFEFRLEVGCEVGAADEWAAGAVAEPFGEGGFFVFVKLFGFDVFNDGKVFRGRAHVLAEREHADAVGDEVIHRLKHFFLGFAESEHESAFGDDFAFGKFLGFFEHSE